MLVLLALVLCAVGAGADNFLGSHATCYVAVAVAVTTRISASGSWVLAIVVCDFV